MKSLIKSQSVFFKIIKNLIQDFLKKNKKDIAIYAGLLFFGTTLSIVGITKLSAALYKQVSDQKRNKSFQLFYIIILVSLVITTVNFFIDKKENELAPKFRSHVILSLTKTIFEQNDKQLLDILPIKYRRFVSSTSHASYYLFKSIIKTYIPNVVLLLIMVLFLFKLDKYYFIIFVVAIIICFLIFNLNQKQLVAKASTAEEHIRSTDNYSFDVLSSLDTVISRGMHNNEFQQVKENVESTEELLIHFNHFTDRVNYAINYLVAFIIFMIMALALDKIGKDNQTVNILAALTLMQTLRTKLVGLSSTNVAAINEYSKAKSNTLDQLYSHSEYEKVNTNYKIKDNPTIEFKDVVFKYEGTTENILNNFNFTLHFDKINILKGHSGSGKSTTCKLLLKLFKPCQGDILIDKMSIKNISNEELRKNIIFLNQDLNILNRSIADIISYGNDSTIDEVRKEFSNVQKYFPNKTLASVVGRNGENLSSGQKMLTRVLNTKMSKAKVIVMDEPTTGMNETLKQAVLGIIKTLNDTKTVFIITHSKGVVDYFSKSCEINLKEIKSK